MDLKAEDLKGAMGRADNAGSSPNCRTLGILKRMIYGLLEEIRNEDFHEGEGRRENTFDAPFLPLLHTLTIPSRTVF